MEYKGYNISDVNSLLLFDILQVQQEILAELKLNHKEIIPEVEKVEEVEETKIIEKEINNPVKKKPTAKKKSTPKTVTKPKV